MQEVLQSIVEASSASHAEIERKLGLPKGKLASILTGRVELSVKDLYRIPRAIGVDAWEVLIPVLLRGGVSEELIALLSARSESLPSRTPDGPFLPN